MNLAEYLLPQDERPWEVLLADWNWLLPASYEVWLVNRFSDLFILADDGTVHLLDTGAGSLIKVAESQEHFATLAEDRVTAANWLMIDATDALVRRGILLGKGQCYSYKLPPAVGGKYELANFEACDLHIHLSINGQICERNRSLPEGTRINSFTTTHDP
jgi:hypothetical protein